jgi:LAO/AO transport system kinase
MSANDLLIRFQQGDRLALARLMTLVEARPPEIYQIMSQVARMAKGAPRLGITGPPGAGKSTVIDGLIRLLRRKNKTVGAVAIDPSSPFSGGAVLGDRVRMQDHAVDPGVFIRSLGSRGSHGGISRATMEVALLLDAFGMDEILIETVGVGQTELDIMGIANTTVVVMVPEAGDTVQTLKAGLMEIGDIFVVNKADRDGADRMAAELRAMVEISPSPKQWAAPVLLASAREGKGLEELLEAVMSHRRHLADRPEAEAFRRNYLKRQFLEIILAELSLRLDSTPEIESIARRILSGSEDPYAAAAELLSDPSRLAQFLRLRDK